MLKKVAIASAGLLGCCSAYDYLSESYVFSRNIRTVACGLNILYSYKIAFNQQNYLEIHDRIAKDIYETCMFNDGLYVKFGQGIAAMDHLLPPPFYKHMSKLQDKAKSAPFDKIKKVFESEVGQKLEDVFLQFDKEPIASASLAQVHKAILKDGSSVAVKIQKPNIKKQFASDMAMHYLINWVLEKAFDLPLLQFVDDIQINLQKQLDFRIQAQNSKIATKKFKQIKRTDVHVPLVIDKYSRERVMVSEWIDAIKITQSKKLQQLGFDQKKVLSDLIRAFAQQIFITGNLHCDPHPGNVFVRPNPLNKKKHQIVILDFGLCIDINDKFRREYATFWKAMFLQDKQTMTNICNSWGLKHVEHFAGWQIMRPYNPQKLINSKVQKKDVLKMQSKLKQDIKELMNNTKQFPKQLLFISRNMNLVRSLNKFYGGKADRLYIMAQTAYIGSQIASSRDLQKQYRYSAYSFGFSIRLLILKITNWYLSLFYHKNVDDLANQELQKNTQSNFQKYGFKTADANSYNA